jgi:hypothetical protein
MHCIVCNVILGSDQRKRRNFRSLSCSQEQRGAIVIRSSAYMGRFSHAISKAMRGRPIERRAL